MSRHDRKKADDELTTMPMDSNSNQLNIQSMSELDEEVRLAAAAYADAEQGLENLALFNEEMS